MVIGQKALFVRIQPAYWSRLVILHAFPRILYREWAGEVGSIYVYINVFKNTNLACLLVKKHCLIESGLLIGQGGSWCYISYSFVAIAHCYCRNLNVPTQIYLQINGKCRFADFSTSKFGSLVMEDGKKNKDGEVNI